MIITEEGHFTEAECPFKIKANFSTLGSIKKTSRQEPIVSFSPVDNIRDLLAFSASTKYDEYDLSPNPVDMISCDTIFLETDIAQRMTLKVN